MPGAASSCSLLSSWPRNHRSECGCSFPSQSAQPQTSATGSRDLTGTLPSPTASLCRACASLPLQATGNRVLSLAHWGWARACHDDPLRVSVSTPTPVLTFCTVGDVCGHQGLFPLRVRGFFGCHCHLAPRVSLVLGVGNLRRQTLLSKGAQRPGGAPPQASTSPLIARIADLFQS